MTPLRLRQSLQAEPAGLNALLQSTQPDPWATPVMRGRIEMLEEKLQKLSEKPPLAPTTELFFRDGPTFGSEGLEATFTSEVLESYQNMVTIANPPFSLEKWGDEVWTSDPFGRNFAGMPPGKSGDCAWVQHMVKSMAAKSGRMAVVLPHGVLFRMGKEGEIPEKILGMDLLEAVIGLGPNLFYGTGLAACILIFRQRKKPDRQRKVLTLSPWERAGVRVAPRGAMIPASLASSRWTKSAPRTAT